MTKAVRSLFRDTDVIEVRLVKHGEELEPDETLYPLDETHHGFYRKGHAVRKVPRP